MKIYAAFSNMAKNGMKTLLLKIGLVSQGQNVPQRMELQTVCEAIFHITWPSKTKNELTWEPIIFFNKHACFFFIAFYWKCNQSV